MSRLRWAYGVTTCPQRRKDLLPRTLASLRLAGFDRPHLFVDGARDGQAWADEFGLDVTCRFPAVNVYGNWLLSLTELYLRHPAAERLAVFQDDLTTVRNLREYLSRAPYPEKGYLNLYTFASNQSYCPPGRVGWFESRPLNEGDPARMQTGRGALALVFSRPAVLTLLSHPHTTERAQDATYGWRKVDGGVVTAMNLAGWREYVHNPGLVQHTGHASTMCKRNVPGAREAAAPKYRWPADHLSPSFPGESYNALDLLGTNEISHV